MSRKLRKNDFSTLATTKISFSGFSQKGSILGYMLHHNSYINAAIADNLMHEEDLYDLIGQEYINLGWDPKNLMQPLPDPTQDRWMPVRCLFYLKKYIIMAQNISIQKNQSVKKWGGLVMEGSGVTMELIWAVSHHLILGIKILNRFCLIETSFRSFAIWLNYLVACYL